MFYALNINEITLNERVLTHEHHLLEVLKIFCLSIVTDRLHPTTQSWTGGSNISRKEVKNFSLKTEHFLRTLMFNRAKYK
jgi:hypothetical protein